MQEFIDEFKDIKVGQKIRIRTKYIYHPRRYMPIHSNFLNFIKTSSNQFTVDTMQLYDGDETVLIAVEEVVGSLEYEQIEPVGQGSKVFNWHRSSIP